jgi:hypothetical protein
MYLIHETAELCVPLSMHWMQVLLGPSSAGVMLHWLDCSTLKMKALQVSVMLVLARKSTQRNLNLKYSPVFGD